MMALVSVSTLSFVKILTLNKIMEKKTKRKKRFSDATVGGNIDIRELQLLSPSFQNENFNNG